MKGRLHHLAWLCFDVKKTADFYCQHLDFRSGNRPAFMVSVGPGIWIVNDALDVEVHLTEVGDQYAAFQHRFTPESVVEPHPYYYDHLALEVDDLPQLQERLQKAGVHTFRGLFGDFGLIQVYFKDPDGRLVELRQLGT